MKSAAGLALQPTSYSDPTDLQPVHLTTVLRGGIVCVWRASSGSYVQVVALSSDGANPTAPDSSSCRVGGPGCYASMTLSGYWLAWNWSNGPITATDNSKLAAFGAALRASVKAAGPAPQLVQPTGSWQKSVDCSALASDSGLLAKLGGGSWRLHASDEPQMPLRANAPEWNNGEFTACVWTAGASVDGQPYGSAKAFAINILPGSAWYASRVEAIAGSTVTHIPGAGRAVKAPDPDRCSNTDPVPDPCNDLTVNVFDGVNWLQIVTNSANLARDTAVIPSLLSTLEVRH